MRSARDEIVGRIRAIDRMPPVPAQRGYRRVGDRDSAGRVKLFSQRVSDYRAEVGVVAADSLAAAIGAACLARGATRVGIPAALPPAWRPDSVELVEDHGLSTDELDALDAVLTGCTVAIADTGTIVLAAGPAEGRRALSLVPDLHVCIVQATQIVELVTEATAVVEDLVERERRPITFISGPSATSDIELSRVEGVHGPRTLVVYIATEEDP